MESHERRRHKRAVLGLEEAGDRLADRDDERANVEDANDASRQPLGSANLGLQIGLCRLCGYPTTGGVSDEEDVLPRFHKGRENLQNSFGVLLSLRISARRRLPVKVGFVDVTDVEFCEVSRWELRAMGRDPSGLQCFQQGAIGGGGMVGAVAENHGHVGGRHCR